MTIIRVKHSKENPYVIINKKALWDENLSLDAIGLWARLLSRPDDWVVRIAELCKSCKCGETKMYRLIKELIDNGYAYKYQIKNNKGRFENYEYIIFENKLSAEEIKKMFPLLDFPDAGDPDAENEGLLSNKEDIQIKENTNTSSSSTQAAALAQEFFFALQDAHGKDFKKPNLDSWAKEFDRMLRIDKYEPSTIRKVMIWATQDSFWCSNILSAKKLREKFLSLKIKMENPSWKQKHKPKPQLVQLDRTVERIPSDPDTLAQLFPNA